MLEDGTPISEPDEIIDYLESNHSERADAGEHRERAAPHWTGRAAAATISASLGDATPHG